MLKEKETRTKAFNPTGRSIELDVHLEDIDASGHWNSDMRLQSKVTYRVTRKTKQAKATQARASTSSVHFFHEESLHSAIRNSGL